MSEGRQGRAARLDDARTADGLDLVAPPPARAGPDWPVVVIGALLAVVAAAVAYEAHRVSGRRVVYGLSPGGVPYAVAAGLAFLAACVAILGWRGKFPEREHDRPVPVMWIVGGLVAQMVLLRPAGFSIATGLVFAATAKAMGRGPLWATVPGGILLAFAIWVVFTQGLTLSLPAGPPEAAFLDLIRPAAPAPAPAPPAG